MDGTFCWLPSALLDYMEYIFQRDETRGASPVDTTSPHTQHGSLPETL